MPDEKSYVKADDSSFYEAVTHSKLYNVADLQLDITMHQNLIDQLVQKLSAAATAGVAHAQETIDLITTQPLAPKLIGQKTLDQVAADQQLAKEQAAAAVAVDAAPVDAVAVDATPV